MRLIAFEHDAVTKVAQCHAETREDVSAFLAKSGYGSPKWREITQAEYDQIIAARPKRTPVLPSLPAAADADMRAALGILVDAVERLDAKNRTLEAKLESTIDLVENTDIRGA